MKIVVLTGSARLQGNSSKLADAFIEGAKEAGHEVKRFNCAELKIGGCLGCNYCMEHDSVCCRNDDYAQLRNDLISADAIVFASPVYYFGLAAPLKAAIDRFYAIDKQLHCAKKTALLLSLGDTEAETAQPTILNYRAFTGYLGWTDCGSVIAYGCYGPDDVLKTDAIAQAKRLGQSI